MAGRMFHWYESADDLIQIRKNKWNLFLAKSVSTPSNTTNAPNVIWKSAIPAPTINIGWNVQYAFNWTADVPSAGVTVSLGGHWQAVNKGEVWNIDEYGLWVKDTVTQPTAGWLTVGNVNYTYPDPDLGNIPIYIIVGIQNPVSNDFDTIYVDPTMMCLNSNGKFQPQEGVKAWLGSGLVKGQVYSDTASSGCTLDYSTINEYWATFIFKQGQWISSTTAPSPAAYAPPRSRMLALDQPATNVFTWPIIARAAMKPPIAASAAAGLVTYLTSQFSGFQNVKIEVTTKAGNEISFTYGPKKNAVAGTIEFIGVEATNYSYPDVVSALTSAKKQSQLPNSETWTVTGNEDSFVALDTNGANGANGANGEEYFEEDEIVQQFPYREMKAQAANRMIGARA